MKWNVAPVQVHYKNYTVVGYIQRTQNKFVSPHDAFAKKADGSSTNLGTFPHHNAAKYAVLEHYKSGKWLREDG